MNLSKRIMLLLPFVATHALAAISVSDDAGYVVTLQRPAQRIVTLAPHTMELVHAAGGSNRIVGKCSHSFYPPLARRIPEVSDNRQADVERVLALKPDLVVAWRYGVPQRQIEQLRQSGVTVFTSDPKRLDDIAGSIVRLGKLLGTERRAQSEARKLRSKLTDLAARYGQRSPVRVFYQVSERPLYTLSDLHIVGEAIRLCGGTNVFGAMRTVAPQVDLELVLAANPQAIVSTNVDPSGSGLAFWRKYPLLEAVRRNMLFSLNPDLLDRPGPRMLDGVQALCEVLDKAR
ncbi:MAG: cobalamin-binding protein [Burkholderiaceae bacterium]|nr:cobalamin-binding protein [Burkholderiaceae bacterium]